MMKPFRPSMGPQMNRAGRRRRSRLSPQELTAATTGISPTENRLDKIRRLYGSVDDIDTTFGWGKKREMLRDPYVKASISTLCLGATARPVEVVPPNPNQYVATDDEKRALEVTEFARRNVAYLASSHRSLNLTLYSAMFWSLVTGFQISEIVREPRTYGIDKGKSVLNRIKLKPRETAAFLVDRQNNIDSIAVFTGELETFDNTMSQLRGRLNGGFMIQERGIYDLGWDRVERDKFLIITNSPDDTDSPTGQSALRPGYAAYRMKRDAWAFYLKALDECAMPFTTAEKPVNSPKMKPFKGDDSGEVDEDAEPVDAATVIFQALELGIQGGISVLPEGTNVKRHNPSNSGDPYAAAISVFNSEIIMSILLQLLATGETRHMARAAGQVHQDVLDMAIRHVRRMACDCVTRDVFTPLIRDNFPPEYHHLIPQCSMGEVELNDFAAWAIAFSKLADSGLIHWSQFPFVWSILGLPQADMEQFLEEIENNKQLVGEMGMPTVQKDGSTGPSQLNQYQKQEAGKTITRRMGRQIAGQVQAGFSMEAA